MADLISVKLRNLQHHACHRTAFCPDYDDGKLLELVPFTSLRNEFLLRWAFFSNVNHPVITRVLNRRNSTLTRAYSGRGSVGSPRDNLGLNSIANILRRCGNEKNLLEGKRIHDVIIKRGLEGDRFLGNHLILMYCKCGNLQIARTVFDIMPRRNTFSWNIMIAGYVQHGDLKEALMLFKKMPKRDVVSWNAVITGCARHALINEARNLFDQMPERSVVSWNAMISAYGQQGKIAEALELFSQMPTRDVISWTAMVEAYTLQGLINEALELFEQMPQRDVISWNTILVAYVQKEQLNEALEFFHKMPEKDVVSWNVIIAGFIQQSQFKEAVQLFEEMPEQDIISWNSMIVAYSRLGQITEAQHLFNQMPEKTVTSWNTMITAYAEQGHCKEALSIFKGMQLQAMHPDTSTFNSVLFACNHDGLLDEGCLIFISISQDHCIRPTIEHYSCIADLLGRSCELDVAEAFINNMAMQPGASAWTSLLGSCRQDVAAERAKRAANHLFQLDPGSSAPYALLSNVYAMVGA